MVLLAERCDVVGNLYDSEDDKQKKYVAAGESIEMATKSGVAAGNVAALTKSAPFLNKDSAVAARTHPGNCAYI